jgi:hypothetical protein
MKIRIGDIRVRLGKEDIIGAVVFGVFMASVLVIPQLIF